MRVPIRAIRRELRHPTLWRRVEIVVVAVIGAWLGILAWGHVTTGVGPVEAQLEVAPTLTGDSLLDVAPLGSLTIDSHDGPARLKVTVKEVNVEDARHIVAQPASLASLGDEITSDLRSGVEGLVARSVGAALLGSVLLGLLVFRRVPPTLWAGGVSLVLVAGTGGAAAATWDPESIAEPKFTGVLASAPSVVGSAEDLVANFDQYEAQLAKLVTNVSRLYDVTSTLPIYDPGGSGTIAVLHVSDIHLNPASWGVIRSVREQFDADVVVDSGDLSDHGTAAEDRFFANAIASLGAPYVFVRGNHDSTGTAREVARQPNGVVLDHQVRTVKGLRIYGAGDPRFTPDKLTRDDPRPLSIQEFGREIAGEVALVEPQPDLAVIHDDEAGEYLNLTTPLVLSGHRHTRNTWVMQGGETRMFRQGSTGGSGLRALEREKPTPIMMSVLYFDGQTKRLTAWDDITIGGLGLQSAEITRHLADPAKSLDTTPGATPAQASTPTPGATPAQASTPTPQASRPTPRPSTASR